MLAIASSKKTTIQRFQRLVSRFRRDDDGSLIVFTLYILVVMLMIGGMAVDLMRHETTRVKLQNTTDRAVLAAADLDQTLSPQDVVRDYFAKAGMSSFLIGEPRVTSSFGYRQVEVDAKATIPSMFMHFMGMNSLAAPATATAMEGASEIEISLILDISGSMGSNNKIANLRTAAKDFVDIIYANAGSQNISLNIVPYQMHVNAGASLLSQYNVNRFHNYSNCVSFPETSFDSTPISTTTALTQVSNADFYYNRGPKFGTTPIPACRTDAGTEITVFGSNPATLKAQIDFLTAGGNTSIDIGMKWGTALLDPAAQPVVSGLIGAGRIDSKFAGHPLPFRQANTLKYIVLMTDGINTTQYDLNDSHKAGLSNVWYSASSDAYSVRITENGNVDGDSINNEIWFLPANYYGSNNSSRFKNSAIGTGLQQLSYADLFSRVSLYYNAYWFQYRANGQNSDYANHYTNAYNTVDNATKDGRLDRVCDSAKAQGIVVFSVGFEVDAHGASVMEKCASSPTHFYAVAGPQINAAFAAIARDITDLKLTN